MTAMNDIVIEIGHGVGEYPERKLHTPGTCRVIAAWGVGGDVTSERAERSLAGSPPSEEAFDTAARLAAEDCSPQADQRGSAEYKRHLAHELTLRALRSATARALREEG